MNTELLKESLDKTQKTASEKLSGLPIKVYTSVRFENARHEECEEGSRECRYVNGDIYFLPEGSEEKDAYLFGLCLSYKEGGELTYPSSKKYAPDAETEFNEMLANALEYADGLSKSEDPLLDMAYDIQRSRAAMTEYEGSVEKMKKRSLLLLGIGAAVIALVVIISVL